MTQIKPAFCWLQEQDLQQRNGLCASPPSLGFGEGMHSSGTERGALCLPAAAQGVGLRKNPLPESPGLLNNAPSAMLDETSAGGTSVLAPWEAAGHHPG